MSSDDDYRDISNRFMDIHTYKKPPNRLTSLIFHSFYKYLIWSKSGEKCWLGGTYYLATFNQFLGVNDAF